MNLSKLFSGSPSPAIEFVLARRGPFTGRKMSVGAFDQVDYGTPKRASLTVAEFGERNGMRFWKDEELELLVQ